MVQELAFAMNTIVLRVYDAFDEVFGAPVDDKHRRRRLIAVLERVGVLGL